MKLATMISGGKDSLYATYLAKKAGHEISCIISIISENPDSYMFHVPNAHLAKEQAKAMNLPIMIYKTKGTKEKELDDMKKALQDAKSNFCIEGIVTGAIASNYQKSRVDNICKELGLESIAPLWNRNNVELLKEMIRAGFEIIITAVAAPPLDEKWLGKKIDDECIQELLKISEKHGISVLGEGGEIETFVINCPLFSKRIEVLSTETLWDSKTRSGVLKINKIED
ncbi:TIGR00289 family protein [Candidatus Woesearchaeota archaeon]|nr:TIGR00289 family protein [Candidatus Woesearchaeota archaeon]